MTDLTIVNDEAYSEKAAAERESWTVEQLDVSNEQRLAALVSGQLGMPAQPPQGLFENLRQMTVLDAIATSLGVKELADRTYALQAAKLLDQFEAMVRQAVIRSGGGGHQIDLSAVRDINGQLKKNREQRRAEARAKTDDE